MEINSSAFFTSVGEIARSTGQEDFYGKLVALPAQILGSERYLVVRYARYAVPDFIVNNAMTDEAIEIYNSGLYRLDPLLRLAHSGFMRGVVTLSSLRSGDVDNTYFDEIFRSAIIFDELAILMKAPGRICIALCIERSSHLFNDDEVKQMELLLPMLEGLHQSHVEKIFAPAFSRDASNAADENEQAVMVLDKENKQVWCNREWENAAAEFSTPLSKFIHKNRSTGIVSLDQDRVLHWERLTGNFAIAPEGKICIIEKRGPGYIVESFETILQNFGDRYTLTSRERDIVELVLRGYPNALIAKELEISAGTVRNHRHRLYFKLDITTERELFHMFLSEVTGVPATDKALPNSQPV